MKIIVEDHGDEIIMSFKMDGYMFDLLELSKSHIQSWLENGIKDEEIFDVKEVNTGIKKLKS